MLILHAAGGCTKNEHRSGARAIAEARDDLGLPEIDVPPLSYMNRGGFVGICVLEDVVVNTITSGYAMEGCLGFILRDIEELPFVRAPGSLGLFDVDVSTKVMRPYRDAAERLRKDIHNVYHGVPITGRRR